MTKIPYRAEITGDLRYKYRRKLRAKSDDPSTWSIYEQALSVLKTSQSWPYPYDFLMCMCDGTFTLADQDHCVDKETGQIDAQAYGRAVALNSWTERSWSDDGLHTLALGTVPRGRKGKQLELYSERRPVVFTGKHLVGTPAQLEPAQQALDALYAEVFPGPVYECPPQSGTCSIWPIGQVMMQM